MPGTPESNQPAKTTFSWVGWVAFGGPFFVAGLVYFQTSAAGLTWQHGGDDGGDLAAAVVLDGVPHPTGYPLYIYSGKLLLVLASDPTRALSLTSALWGALSAGVLSLVVYRFNRQLLGQSFETKNSLNSIFRETVYLSGGVLSGLGLACARLVWSQAIIIEIYSLNLLLLTSLLLALEWWWEKPDNARRLYMLAGVAGVGLGYHRTAIFSILAVFVFVYLTRRNSGPRPFAWKQLSLAVLLLGLVAGLPSLTLLLRGGHNPGSNWANLSWSNPLAFWQYISGEEYRYLLFAAPVSQDLSRVAASVGLLLEQFGPLGLALGWTGLACAWFTLPQYRHLAGLLSVGLVGHLGFAAIYAADNSQVYLIPFFTFWSMAIGFGLAWLSLTGLARWPRYNRLLVGLVLGVALLGPGMGLVANYTRLDLSQERGAEIWAKAQLTAAPDSAILTSRQDGVTFALWYLQYVERYRTEIAIIDYRLLDRDWYRNNLARLYPDLKLPPIGSSSDLRAANPNRPLVPLTLPTQTGLP